jgi:hypothetical protein
VTRTVFIVVAALAMAVGAPSRSTSQPADIVAGTWALSVSKSMMTPGPLPKSQTRTYQVTGKHVKSVQKGIDAEGKPTLVQFSANYDGKDYPYTGSPLWDTIALRWVDDYTVSFVQKKNGKVALTGKRVVSTNGKTMTISGKGRDADGKPSEIFLVFDRRQSGVLTNKR